MLRDALEDFRQTIETSAERLLLISEQQSRQPLSEGKWSAKEVIGHLIDSAAHNHQRFVRAQFKDALVFPGYEQEQWVSVQGYAEESWLLLVHLWRAYNLHLAHLAARIPEETLKKPRAEHNLHQIAWQTVSQAETVTLEYFILDYIGHLKNHLRQVFDEDGCA